MGNYYYYNERYRRPYSNQNYNPLRSRDHWPQRAEFQHKPDRYHPRNYPNSHHERQNRQWNSRPKFVDTRESFNQNQYHKRTFPEVYDRPYSYPNYDRFLGGRQYNIPHYYDVRNHDSDFMLPTTNRFSVLGNY